MCKPDGPLSSQQPKPRICASAVRPEGQDGARSMPALPLWMMGRVPDAGAARGKFRKWRRIDGQTSILPPCKHIVWK